MSYYSTPSIARQTTVKAGALVNGNVGLFTVAGGRVRVYEIFAHVTTLIGAAALTVKVQADVAVGTDTDLCAASASLADKPAGTLLVVTGVAADALVVSASVGALRSTGLPMIVNPCTLTSIVTNGTTGALDWYVTWEPIDIGATIVAA